MLTRTATGKAHYEVKAHGLVVLHGDPSCPKATDTVLARDDRVENDEAWECSCWSTFRPERSASVAGLVGPSIDPPARSTSTGTTPAATPVDDARQAAARAWLAANHAGDKFLTDLHAQRRPLSDRQLECVDRNVARLARQMAPKPIAAAAATSAPAVDGIDLTDLRDGYYAAPGRDGQLVFLRVARNRKTGWLNVALVIGGRADERTGAQGPGRAYRGGCTVALRNVLADPDAAALTFANELEHCSRCNRHLTDETSRRFGIGPECRSK